MRFLMVMMLMAWHLHAGDVKRVVFDVTTADLKRFEQIVFEATKSHTEHYAAQGKAFRAVFVIHGEAYRFFLKKLEGTRYEEDRALQARRAEFEQRFSTLVDSYDVTFEACSIGMAKRRIAPADLYPFVTPIFSATSGLIEWQEKGYAYVPVE